MIRKTMYRVTYLKTENYEEYADGYSALILAKAMGLYEASLRACGASEMQLRLAGF